MASQALHPARRTRPLWRPEEGCCWGPETLPATPSCSVWTRPSETVQKAESGRQRAPGTVVQTRLAHDTSRRFKKARRPELHGVLTRPWGSPPGGARMNVFPAALKIWVKIGKG